MSVFEWVCVVVGFLVASSAMVTVMVKVNRKERAIMERRRQEWMDAGGSPEDRPHFDLGLPPSM